MPSRKIASNWSETAKRSPKEMVTPLTRELCPAKTPMPQTSQQLLSAFDMMSTRFLQPSQLWVNNSPKVSKNIDRKRAIVAHMQRANQFLHSRDDVSRSLAARSSNDEKVRPRMVLTVALHSGSERSDRCAEE